MTKPATNPSPLCEPTVQTHLTTIPPAEAQILLDSQFRNRPIKPHVVENYTESMRRGLWKLNGETIKISDAGELIDGQHRLAACVASGIPLRTFVTTGLNKQETNPTLDCGALRSNGDFLHFAGVEKGRAVSAAAKTLSWLRQGLSGKRIHSNSNKELPARADLLEFVESNLKIQTAVDEIGKIKKAGKTLQPKICAALLVLFSEVSSWTQAKEFFAALLTGAGLDASDPIYLLRSRFLEDTTQSTRYRKNMSSDLRKAALTIRAWNHWVSNNRPSRLLLRNDELPRIYSKQQATRSLAQRLSL